MIFNGTEIEFPAIPKISFYKLKETLDKMAARKADKERASYAKELLKIFDKYPFLEEGFEDMSYLKKYKKPIETLTKAFFPETLVTNEIKGATSPFSFDPFYQSERFINIEKAAGEHVPFIPNGWDTSKMYIFGCTMILNTYFGFPVDVSMPMFMDIPNRDFNLIKTYRIAFNADMIEVIPTKKAKKVTHEEYLELMDDFYNVDKWREKFPPNSWIMRGVGIVNLFDVTMDQSISGITSNLLVKSQDSFERIQQNIRSLFNFQEMHIGFIAYENNSFKKPHKEGVDVILLGDDEELACNQTLCDWSYHELIETKHPLVVTDVDSFNTQNSPKLAKLLKVSGMKSYIIAPLMHEEELLGFLELGSKEKYRLNPLSLEKLNTILPVISMAASRFKEESLNQIEAIIQQECTTIHPSVKWRFEEQAMQYLNEQQSGGHPTFNDIVFKEVYPLYGQLDIKGSSTIRNDGIQKDLITQIEGVKKALQKAHDIEPLPLLDQLNYRIEKSLEELKSGLLAGSEHKILGFLEAEIYPVFDHLKSKSSALKAIVEEYHSILDEKLHIVYHERKKFDDSVMQINRSLAGYLDKKQTEAQAMFPHYFERYKTDGVEYNMYIGQSMARNEQFDTLYLRNLRLWQLITMCELEQEFKQVQKTLPNPLEVASLILVYSTPLAIHFRMDEKRFDVEGAYNARYEIVKKRVDKAHIKGTNERITVPGKIAIVYSSEQDAREYKTYIKFLEDQGFVKQGSLEDLELENLQGISGLRALRFTMNYSKKKALKSKTVTVDEIIREIEKA